MKVTGPGKSQGPSKSKKSNKSSESSGNFGDFLTSGTKEAQGTTTTRSIAKVDALLAVQAAEDPTERASRGRAKARGGKLLDALDDVRNAMLTGNLTVGHMVDVADVVASHRDKVTDPALTAIMDEIDLRAQVELAKMRMSQKK